MKCVQENMPHIPLSEVIGWATLNGAQALGISDWAGSLEVGKRPGVVLLENVDLQSMRLTPESAGLRLV